MITPSKIVLVRIIIDSSGDLDGRNFLPQFTHKGKTRLAAKKVKETKSAPFRKNSVRVMTDVGTSETVQLSSFLENPGIRLLTGSNRNDYDDWIRFRRNGYGCG